MARKVKIGKFIQVPPAQIYFAFTRAIALHEWLCDFATVAPHPGGRMYLWWHGDFYSAGEYTALEQDKLVAFTWFGRGDPGPSQVKVTLEPKDGGTQVTLEHTIPAWQGWKGTPEGFQHEWTVSLENLASVLESGLDKRTMDRPLLGISMNDFNPAIARSMGVPVSDGIRLDEVVEGLGAHQAGLRKDDVLVALDGHPLINDYGALVVALQGKKGGDKVEVIFYRGTEKMTTSMELSKRPVPEASWNPAELAKTVRTKYDECLAALEKCFTGVNEGEAGFRPAPGAWSAKDVLAHLIQNERHWLENLDDCLGGYERLSDDWGGNIDLHIHATVTAYRTARGMLDELRRLSDEAVAYVASLPAEFVARKRTYVSVVTTILDGTLPHSLSHLEQIHAAIAAARKS
jgi:uncharacterized protein YndB with AHSA1/START domain